MQLGVGTEVIQHPSGRLTPQCTDLDNPSGMRCVEDWCDGDIPQGEHVWLRIPQACEERAQ
jgi:hypothetical protein